MKQEQHADRQSAGRSFQRYECFELFLAGGWLDPVFGVERSDADQSKKNRKIRADWFLRLDGAVYPIDDSCICDSDAHSFRIIFKSVSHENYTFVWGGFLCSEVKCWR